MTSSGAIADNTANGLAILRSRFNVECARIRASTHNNQIPDRATHNAIVHYLAFSKRHPGWTSGSNDRDERYFQRWKYRYTIRRVPNATGLAAYALYRGQRRVVHCDQLFDLLHQSHTERTGHGGRDAMRRDLFGYCGLAPYIVAYLRLCAECEPKKLAMRSGMRQHSQQTPSTIELDAEDGEENENFDAYDDEEMEHEDMLLTGDFDWDEGDISVANHDEEFVGAIAESTNVSVNSNEVRKITPTISQASPAVGVSSSTTNAADNDGVSTQQQLLNADGLSGCAIASGDHEHQQQTAREVFNEKMTSDSVDHQKKYSVFPRAAYLRVMDRLLTLQASCTGPRWIRKHPKDQKLLERYAIMKVTTGSGHDGAVLVKRGTNREFVCMEDLYDIIERIHLESGHVGIRLMHAHLSLRYANISREQVAFFISLCETCRWKRANGASVRTMLDTSTIPSAYCFSPNVSSTMSSIFAVSSAAEHCNNERKYFNDSNAATSSQSQIGERAANAQTSAFYDAPLFLNDDDEQFRHDEFLPTSNNKFYGYNFSASSSSSNLPTSTTAAVFDQSQQQIEAGGGNGEIDEFSGATIVDDNGGELTSTNERLLTATLSQTQQSNATTAQMLLSSLFQSEHSGGGTISCEPNRRILKRPLATAATATSVKNWAKQSTQPKQQQQFAPPSVQCLSSSLGRGAVDRITTAPVVGAHVQQREGHKRTFAGIPIPVTVGKGNNAVTSAPAQMDAINENTETAGRFASNFTVKDEPSPSLFDAKQSSGEANANSNSSRELELEEDEEGRDVSVVGIDHRLKMARLTLFHEQIIGQRLDNRLKQLQIERFEREQQTSEQNKQNK